MDVRYINPFIKSVSNVFQTMLSIDITFGKPTAKQNSTPRPDVSAIIGFSGDASGSVVLGFEKSTALKVASAFAGTELGIDDPDFADALGELANMVAGGAKANFEGFNITISLPSVIVGEAHEVIKSKAHPSLVIPCHLSLGDFIVEVAMKAEKTAAVGASS